MELNKIQSNGSWGEAADSLNQNFQKVNNAVEQVKNATTRNKGYFSSDAELKSAFPTANVGDVAYVGSAYPYQTWNWNGSAWVKKNNSGGDESVNLGNYYTKEETDGKFDEADAKLSELGSKVLDNTNEYLKGISGFELRKGFITGTGVWDKDDSLHFILPVKYGDVLTVAQGVNAVVYAILSDYKVDIQTVSEFNAILADGESRKTFSGTTDIVVEPLNARFIYFGVRYNGTDFTPSKIIINGVDITESIDRKVSNIDSKVSNIDSKVSNIGSEVNKINSRISENAEYDKIEQNRFNSLETMNVYDGQMTSENIFSLPEGVITSHFVFPLKEGDYIKIVAPKDQPSVYALLSDYKIATKGAPLMLVNGETRKVVTAGSSTEFLVGSGVKYIAFNVQNGDNYYTPNNFIVNGFDYKKGIFSTVGNVSNNPFIKGYTESIEINKSQGFYYVDNGTFVNNESFITTDFIEVGRSVINAFVAVPNTVSAITLFDNNKIAVGFISGIETGSYLYNYEFNHNDYPNIRYVRITSRSTISGYHVEFIKKPSEIIDDIYSNKTYSVNKIPTSDKFLGHLNLPNFERNYQMIVCYGQSLSDGSDSLFVEDSIIPNTYMLGDILGNSDVLTPLVATNKQHPIISCVNSLSSLYQKYYGEKNFIASSVGIGGRSIAQLSKASRVSQYAKDYDYEIKDSGRYENVFLKALDNAISSVGHDNIECPAIIFLQGERDYVTDSQAPDAMPGSVDSAYACGGDKELYKQRMLDLKNDMQADVMDKFGQTTKPIFCIYQVSGAFIKNDQMTINMAQIEFAQENDDVFLMPSPYFVPDYGAHLSTNGYRWYGEFLAKALFGILCNSSYWKPILPYQFKVDRDKIIISVENNVGKLELDSLLVELSENYGFAVFIDGLYSSDNIQAVSIDDNHIVVSCSQDLTGKSVELVYGGNKTNGSGNVRDNDVYHAMYNYWNDSSDNGTSGKLTIRYRPNIVGKKYPMYNWLASFYKKIQ